MRASQWRPSPFVRRLALVPAAAALVYFLLFFKQAEWRPTVDLAWAIAVVCWLSAWWRSEPSSAPHLPQPYWFYALYAAALLPFCTNWRWAMTADSLGWALGGIDLGIRGPGRSLLSLSGVGQFSYSQLVLHNLFAWFVAPTLFWHRVGQTAVGVLSVAAVYTVYGRLVNPAFGLLVGACALTTSIMIVHTLCSYPLLDAIAAGHAVIAIGLWVRRDPHLRTPWLMLGVATGALFYMTANSWAMAICVWGWLLPLALRRRWPLSHVGLALATIVVIGSPVLLQIAVGQGAELFSQVEKPQWSVAKVVHLSQEAIRFPFASEFHSAGAFGPQLPPGFRWLFVPSILITPLLARYFPGARLIFGFYLVNLVLIVFTQGRYIDVSVKRGLVLIPMATYFVFLPFHRYLRSLVVVLPVIAVWASFGIYDVVARMEPGRTGYTMADGIIEARQRFSDVPVCVYMEHDTRFPTFEPGNSYDQLYGLWPRLQIVKDINDPLCSEVLCYSPQVEIVDLQALGYVEVTMLNSTELRCGRRALSRIDRQF